MEKIGLIQRYLTTPVTFKAAPISEALTSLLQHNTEKLLQIQDEASKFIAQFKEYSSELPQAELDRGYRVTSGLQGEYREFVKDMKKVQTSLDIILEWKLLLYVVNRHLEVFKETLQRGVKTRFITSFPIDERILSMIQLLRESGWLEVKFSIIPQRAGIDIHDKKSARIMTFLNGEVDGIEVLRSTNPALVELLQDYFDMKWQSVPTIFEKKDDNNQLLPNTF